MKPKKSTEVIIARVTPKTKKMIAEFIRRDTHLNESDFIRAAVREKLKRDDIELYNKFIRQREEG